MNKKCWISAVALIGATTLATAFVSDSVPVSVPVRIRGAVRVVVAGVEDVTASFETNEFGDRLIVSHVTLRIEESLKGRPATSLSMDLDGGTVGNLTLEVSSLPKLTSGERGVFFLTQNKQGKYVPHLRGQGILKLEPDNRVKGSSLDLNTIRQMAASVAGQ
jgi:hypothetical protein